MKSCIKKIFTIISFCLYSNIYAQYQNFVCPVDPKNVTNFCTDQNELGISYKAGTDGEEMFDYPVQCLFSAPSAAWFAMKIKDSGNLDIQMKHSAKEDIDFICFGPFNAATKAEMLEFVCAHSNEIFVEKPYSPFGIWGDYETGELHKPGEHCLPSSYVKEYELAWEECYPFIKEKIEEYESSPFLQMYYRKYSYVEEKLFMEGLSLPDLPYYAESQIQMNDVNSDCFRGYIDNFPIQKEYAVDCSYSTHYSELCHITDAKEGEWYLMLITNYSQVPGTIEFKKISGTATTDCNVIVDASSTGPYCEGQTIELTINNAPSDAKYLWTGPNGFSSTLRSPTIPNATLKDAGDYDVQMFVNGSESAVVTVNVVVNPASEPVYKEIILVEGETVVEDGRKFDKEGTFKFNLENRYGCDSTVIYEVTSTITPKLKEAQPVCEGKPTAISILNLPEGATCAWTGPNGFTSSAKEVKFAAATIANAGVYSVDITNNMNEVTTLTSTIVIYQNDTISIEAEIEKGEIYTLGNQSYNKTGEYKKLFKNNYGCDSLVKLNLIVKDEAVLPTIKPAQPVCEGRPTAISIQNLPAGAICSWTGPNGFTSSATEVRFNAASTNNAGTYTVSFILGDKELPELSADIIVYPKDTVFETVTLEHGETYQFNNKTLSVSGIYPAVFKNIYGCDSLVNLNLTILPDTTVNLPIIPDPYFTPNGDGYNDYWQIKGIENYPDAIVTIFDRYGKELIKMRNYNNTENAWDGTYLGNKCPTTDYWYVINIESLDKMFTGHFTLMR